MIIHKDLDVIARITVGKYRTIQRFNYYKYRSGRMLLPDGKINIETLCFVSNKSKKVKFVKGVVPHRHTNIVMVDRYCTNYDGIYIDVDKDRKFKIVNGINIKSFYKWEMSVGELILGMVCAFHRKGLTIIRKDRKLVPIHPRLYLNNQANKAREPYLLIGKQELNYLDYFSNIGDHVEGYLSDYFVNPVDVYLFHILLKNNILTPLFFTDFDIKNVVQDNSIIVPLDNRCLFQARFGNQYNIITPVYSDKKNEYIALESNKLKIGKDKQSIKSNGTQINFKDGAIPILLGKYFPLRYIDEE